MHSENQSWLDKDVAFRRLRLDIWQNMSICEQYDIDHICEVFDAKLIDGEVYEQGK